MVFILIVQKYARYHKSSSVQCKWGDGEYFGEKTYRLNCWDIISGIPIVTMKG